MGLRSLEIFLLLQCEDRLYRSESDVYRRQILTTKVYPRAVRVNVHRRNYRRLFILYTPALYFNTRRHKKALNCINELYINLANVNDDVIYSMIQKHNNKIVNSLNSKA